MQTNETAEIIRRFNQAFLDHEPAGLRDLIAPDCVMESNSAGARWNAIRRP